MIIFGTYLYSKIIDDTSRSQTSISKIFALKLQNGTKFIILLKLRQF
jgi:hypothetical protein